MRRFIRLLIVLWVAGFALWFATIASAQEVLTKADFVAAHQGRWAAPSATGPDAASGGHDYRRTGLSTGTHGQFENGTVRLKSHSYDIYGYSVLSPPTPQVGQTIPLATVLDWGAVPEPFLENRPEQSGTRHHGWYQNALGDTFVSMKAYYAVSGTNFASQMKNTNGFYTITGETSVPDISDVYHHNKVAGYMCAPPASQSNRWDYMLGLVGTAGSGTSSGGLSLIGVKWKDKDGIEKPYGEALIMHDRASHQADYWESMLKIRGCAWIEATVSGTPKQAVVFFGTRAVGAIWYGNPDGYIPSRGEYVNKPADYPTSPLYYTANRTAETLTDAYGGSKGYHAEDRDKGFFIIDARKLEQGNFQVYPEEWVSINELGWFDNFIGYDSQLIEREYKDGDVTASYNPQTGRLLVGAASGYKASYYENTPMFIQFQFTPTSGGLSPNAPSNLRILSSK